VEGKLPAGQPAERQLLGVVVLRYCLLAHQIAGRGNSTLEQRCQLLGRRAERSESVVVACHACGAPALDAGRGLPPAPLSRRLPR
jgi:hypothetical protein